MNWILSAFSDEVDPSIDTQIKALQAHEISFIDLRAVDEFNISNVPDDHAQLVGGKLANAGITVNMLGSPLGKIDIAEPFEPELEKLEHLARMAEIFECRRVRVFSYRNRQEASEAEFCEQAMDRVGRLKTRAAELGLSLFHENERHIFGELAANTKALAEAFHDGESFCVIYDFDNYNRAGEDCWEAYQVMKPFIDAVHLKESNSNGNFVPMGHGAGQSAAILRDLRATGWQGSLTLEPHLHVSQAQAPGTDAPYKDLPRRECFDLAARAVHDLLEIVRTATES
jgi:sugar phosphate isomerase/epimerase